MCRAEYEWDKAELEKEREYFRVLFNWRHRLEDIPQGVIDHALEVYPALAQEARDDRDLRFRVGFWRLRQYNREAAAQAGYPVLEDIEFLHDAAVILAQAEGEAAGQRLAAKWKFPYRQPATLWDVQATRREGDNLLALIADDRGYARHWQYWIAYAWAPAWLVEECGYYGSF